MNMKDSFNNWYNGLTKNQRIIYFGLIPFILFFSMGGFLINQTIFTSKDNTSNTKNHLSTDNNTPDAHVKKLKPEKEYYYGVQLNSEIEQKKIAERDRNLDLNLDLSKEEAYKTREEKSEDEDDPQLKELEALARQAQNNIRHTPKAQTTKAHATKYAPAPKVIKKNPEQKEEEEEEEAEIIGWTAPEIQAKNINKQPSSEKNNATLKLIKARIVGTRKRNNMITEKNNRVKIRTLEPFYMNGVLIPKNKYLIAYANFSNELRLVITYILHNNQQIPCNISIVDSYGQPALEVMGGTGADAQRNASEEIAGDVSSDETVQKVPGASGLIKSIFKKKVKARVNSDIVYLKIE